jgi:competence protein ComEA
MNGAERKLLVLVLFLLVAGAGARVWMGEELRFMPGASLVERAQSADLPSPPQPLTREDAEEGSQDRPPAEQPENLLDINRATLEELDALKGVGPGLAAKILEHRTAHGPFSTAEDLLQVPGIGKGRLNSLQTQIRFPK